MAAPEEMTEMGMSFVGEHVLRSSDPLTDATVTVPTSHAESEPFAGQHLTCEDIPDHLKPRNHCTDSWAQRQPYEEKATGLNVLGLFQLTPHVWGRIEYALRVTILGILPSAILTFVPEKTKTLSGAVFIVICGGIVVPRPTLGASIQMLGVIITSLILNLAISEAAIAANVRDHWASYLSTFFGVIVLVGFFTRGFVTKLTLYFFTAHIVLHWYNKLYVDKELKPHMFPLHFLCAPLLGCAVGIAPALFPFPRTNRQVAENLFRSVTSAVAICLHGLCRSVWVSSNVVREVNLTRVIAVRETIGLLLEELRMHLPMMQYEFTGSVVRGRAVARVKLVETLIEYLDGIISFVEGLAQDPDPWDKAERVGIWGEHMSPAILVSCDYVDEFLKALGDLDRPIETADLDKLLYVQSFVLKAYDNSRKKSLMEDLSWLDKDDPGTAFPFPQGGFFLFNYGNFFASASEYDPSLESGTQVPSFFFTVLLSPVEAAKGVWEDLVQLLGQDRTAIVRLREAIKLAFAMTSALAFLTWQQAQDPGGGAASIGFTKDADPTTNIMSSMNYVMATVLGSVCGYLAGGIASSTTEVIVWMCVLGFIFALMKTGRKYGQLGFLASFFSLSALVGGVSNDKQLLTRIQQNVAAMFWLTFTHVILWPVFPTDKFRLGNTRLVGELRALILSVMSHIESMDGDVSELMKLHGAVRGLIASQRMLLPTVSAEPSLMKQDYPIDDARKFVEVCDRTVAYIRPAIVAFKSMIAMHEGQAELPPDQQSPAYKMLLAIRSRMCDLSVEIEALLRAIHASHNVGTQEVAQDMAPDVLTRHARIKQKIDTMRKEVLAVFFTNFKSSIQSKRLAVPFAIPAVQTINHFFGVIGNQLRILAIAVARLRRKEIIRT